MATTSQTNRQLVNVFLAVFLVVMAVDVFVPASEANDGPKDKLNTVLVVTGLWQGPWRLYAPNVMKDNLRLRAEIVFADQAVATWDSPDWSKHSVLRRFIEVRHINYFNAILLAGREVAWDALCIYLARTVPHPEGKAVAVAGVRLLLRGATIPSPADKPVPAGPYLEFDDWQVIWPRSPPS